MVIRQGMTLVGVGLLLGIVVSIAAGRAIAGFLFEVSGNDPLTLVAVTVILAGVALFACWLPARRAARIDPLAAIRAE